MEDRVVVFIDYQNVYRNARRAFAPPGEFHTHGQINPKAIGLDLAAGRDLREVRIYRGMPDGRKDARGHGACQRQLAWWSKLSQVTAITRPLRYPRDWPECDEAPQEKGIDVQIAIDFVRMAIDEIFDVGILFSADTDLRPPLEMVIDRRWATPEVAAWQPPDQPYPNRLTLGEGRFLHCHFLDDTSYRYAADDTDYNIKRR